MKRFLATNCRRFAALLLLSLLACGAKDTGGEESPDPTKCSEENLSGNCEAGQSCFRGECLIPDALYYDTDVVPEDLRDIYGSWLYMGYTTGWSIGWRRDFDELRLTPYGVFECISDGVTTLRGRIEIYELGGRRGVRLIPDPETPEDSMPNIVYWSVHGITQFITLTGDDELWISGYNDGARSRFIRVGARAR